MLFVLYMNCVITSEVRADANFVCALRMRQRSTSSYGDRAEMLNTPVPAPKTKVRAALGLANIDRLISAADNKGGARSELDPPIAA